MCDNDVRSFFAAFKPCYLVYFGKNREIQPSNVLQRGGYFARHLHSTLRGIGPGAFRKGQFISQRGRENVRMRRRPRECEIGRSKCVHCGTLSNASWDFLWDWFWDCIWDCVRDWLYDCLPARLVIVFSDQVQSWVKPVGVGRRSKFKIHSKVVTLLKKTAKNVPLKFWLIVPQDRHLTDLQLS